MILTQSAIVVVDATSRCDQSDATQICKQNPILSSTYPMGAVRCLQVAQHAKWGTSSVIVLHGRCPHEDLHWS